MSADRLWYPDRMLQQRASNYPYPCTPSPPYRTAPYSTTTGYSSAGSPAAIPGAVASCLTWNERGDSTETSRSTKLTTTTTTLETTERLGEERHKSTVTLHVAPSNEYVDINDLQQQQQQRPSRQCHSAHHQQQQQQQPTYNQCSRFQRHNCSNATEPVRQVRWTGRSTPGLTGGVTSQLDDADELTLIDAVHRATSGGGNFDVLPRRTRPLNYHQQQQQQQQQSNCYSNTRYPRSQSESGINRRTATTMATPVRRWVEVLEDEQGRTVDMTIVRPNTPLQRQATYQTAAAAAAAALPLTYSAGFCPHQHADKCSCVNMRTQDHRCCHTEPQPPTCHHMERLINASNVSCCCSQPVPTCHPPRRPMTPSNRLQRSKTTLSRPHQYDVSGNCCSRHADVTRPDVIVPAVTKTMMSSTPCTCDVMRPARPRHQVMTQQTVPSAAEASQAAARDALMAIYQAGKPDEMFHVRAPSTAVLRSMLSAVTMDTNQKMAATEMLRKFESSNGALSRAMMANSTVNQQTASRACQSCCPRGFAAARRQYTATAPCCSNCHHGNTQQYPPNVISDVSGSPVKVNVECAPNADTVVSLHVQSKPMLVM